MIPKNRVDNISYGDKFILNDVDGEDKVIESEASHFKYKPTGSGGEFSLSFHVNNTNFIYSTYFNVMTIKNKLQKIVIDSDTLSGKRFDIFIQICIIISLISSQ